MLSHPGPGQCTSRTRVPFSNLYMCLEWASCGLGCAMRNEGGVLWLWLDQMLQEDQACLRSVVIHETAPGGRESSVDGVGTLRQNCITGVPEMWCKCASVLHHLILREAGQVLGQLWLRVVSFIYPVFMQYGCILSVPWCEQVLGALL